MLIIYIILIHSKNLFIFSVKMKRNVISKSTRMNKMNENGFVEI
jgi:hypothetical protein